MDNVLKRKVNSLFGQLQLGENDVFLKKCNINPKNPGIWIGDLYFKSNPRLLFVLPSLPSELAESSIAKLYLSTQKQWKVMRQVTEQFCDTTSCHQHIAIAGITACHTDVAPDIDSIRACLSLGVLWQIILTIRPTHVIVMAHDLLQDAGIVRLPSILGDGGRINMTDKTKIDSTTIPFVMSTITPPWSNGQPVQHLLITSLTGGTVSVDHFSAKLIKWIASTLPAQPPKKAIFPTLLQTTGLRP